MTEINQYKIYCTTDSKFEYVWSTTTPTVCPVNTGHTIDSNSIRIVKTVGDPIVTIKEEEVPTGGHFRSETISMDTASYETSVTDFVWPIPISVLSIIVHPTTGMECDKISVDIAPQTVIGILTANAATGATVLNVSSTVTDNTKVGFHCCLSDGTNVNNCGRVVEIGSGQITMETPTTNSFDASTPTYVVQDIYMMYQHELPVSAVPFPVGNSKIGASYLPANTTVRCTYQNCSTGSKHFVATVEYLY